MLPQPGQGWVVLSGHALQRNKLCFPPCKEKSDLHHFFHLFFTAEASFSCHHGILRSGNLQGTAVGMVVVTKPAPRDGARAAQSFTRGLGQLEDEEGSTSLVSARLTLAQPCSHCAQNADAGGCSGVSVVLGSLREKGTAERQDILVLPVLHPEIWLGRGVKKMRVEGSRFCRKTGRVHSALNELCKTS